MVVRPEKLMRRTLVLVAVWCMWVTRAATPHGAAGGEWRSYAGDLGGTKYSPLDQSTGENFGDLEIAWHWKTVDTHLTRSTGLARHSSPLTLSSTC